MVIDLDAIRAWARDNLGEWVMPVQAMADEIERLRAELATASKERDKYYYQSLTTLVGCVKCGHGVPARYLVSGNLCPQCAEEFIDELLGKLNDNGIEAGY